MLAVLAVVIDQGDVHSRRELEHNFRQRAEIASQLIISTLQESIAQSAQADAAGLGLSLTRRLVEAQGGTVGVDTAPGRGSSFYAVLTVAIGPTEPLELVLTGA